jgi:hypothetical protein
VKTSIAALVLVPSLFALAGCGADSERPAPEKASSSPSTATADPGATTEVGASCEQFNQMDAELTGLPDGTDPDAYDDFYARSQEAGESAPAETRGLFALLGLISLDYGQDGELSQDTRDSVRDVTFGTAQVCTAAGVTLKL